MDPDAFPDYGRLAAAVKKRRLALRLSLAGAARQGTMSPITWTRVENGLNVRELTYAGIDYALRWELGSSVRVLEGGDPAPLPPGEATPDAPDESTPMRYPDDPILQYLWDLPDPDLVDSEREALVQLYLALRRTADNNRINAASPGQGQTFRNAM
ncbi:hypothetical protein AB0F88_17365 [Streptosporangium sp. NPDC023963]|uniref:hypothetical protein n=1 Tax=Streptosporangium sp. NPDC023963 TaxID=3155608 RepID=UPI00343BC414